MSSTPSDPNVGSSRIVLTPKLRAPSPRSEQLVRSGLLELLAKSSSCKLTLISAPVGYGKTTLLSHWRQAEGDREGGLCFAWVSLDQQENYPVRLWRHVGEGGRESVPEDDFRVDVFAGMSAPGQRLV